MNNSSPFNRGFLLLVVIGMLAVLLTICIGFLSYSRGELMSVAAQRNKADTGDVFHSAMDWTLANISNDLMSGGSMDQNKYCAFTINPGGGSGGPGWWFRPLQMGTCAFLPANWGFGLQPTTKPSVEAPWAYLPSDFFPGGGVRGRFSVQIFDVNACINVNDWNEDCTPSQCQMAHMIADAYGFVNFENYRWYRDIGDSTWGYLPFCPIRYQEAWRVGSHTARYVVWPDWCGTQTQPFIVSNTASPSWVTGNTSWLSMYGPQYSSLCATMQADGLPMYQTVPAQNYLGSALFCTPDTPNQNQADRAGTRCWGLSGRYGANPQSAGYLPWCMAGFVTQSGSDPDTGRCPININSCYNSGEILPFDYWSNPPTYTMEGVWNVESLRRIIKVGNFWTGSVWKNAQTDWNNGTLAGPLAGQSLTPNEKMIVEKLKLKLAYKYQETLCRYFTGTYAHQNQNQTIPPFCNLAIATYPVAYPANSPVPSNYCKVTDYSSPRFPVSLQTFRKNVHDDFINALTQNYTNPFYKPGTLAGVPAMPARPTGQLDASYTDGTVNFDEANHPEIANGKLDVRTACACYDNMIPGKPADMAESAGGFKGCTIFGAGDPLYELYVLQLARQEDMDDPYNIDPIAIKPGSSNDARTLRSKLGASPSTTMLPPFQSAPPNPVAPWPTSGKPAAVPANNIYGRWVDNPNLSAVSYFDSGNYFNPPSEVQLYDHFGKCLTLLPKGNDICSMNAIIDGKTKVLASNSVALVTGYDPAPPPPPTPANPNPARFNDPTLKDPITGLGAPIPTGPWLDGTSSGNSNLMNRSAAKQHDVPWRQMCFSPDSFSTELTTTSTTFMLIINAQLVDGASVTANPANPALHTDLCWNQWGVVVELAPDVFADKSATPAGGNPGDPPVSMFPTGAGPTNPNIPEFASFWQWYKNEMPRKTKTYEGTSPSGNAVAMSDSKWLDDSWLDDLCPSIVYRNNNNTARFTSPYGRTFQQCRMPWKSLGGWTPPLNGGAPDTENSSATFVRDWKYVPASNTNEVTTGCDIHQVPPAGVPSNRGADKIYDGFGGTNQTKKRVIIRSIWCLNEGIEM